MLFGALIGLVVALIVIAIKNSRKKKMEQSNSDLLDDTSNESSGEL